MSIADKIAFTRLLVSDRKKIIRNLQIGIGDGSENIFRVPILTVQTLASGLPDLNVVTFDPDTSQYVDHVISDFDYDTGDVQLSPIPAEGQVVIAYFSYIAFTDAEITMVLGRSEVVGDEYTCAAILLQSILSDTSRFISFTQGDTKYNFSDVSKRLERQVARYLKQSTISAESITVPFVPDVLSRIDYITVPLIHPDVPYYFSP